MTKHLHSGSYAGKVDMVHTHEHRQQFLRNRKQLAMEYTVLRSSRYKESRKAKKKGGENITTKDRKAYFSLDLD